MFLKFQPFGMSEDIYKSFDRNLNFPYHVHKAFEIVLVISGEMEIAIDNSTYFLQSGDAVLIFPHQIHSMTSTNCQQMVCIFSPEIVKTYAGNVIGKIPSDNKLSLLEYQITLLENLSVESSLLEKKGILYSLCAQFDKTAHYIKRVDDEKNLLYKIFEFVEENYDKDCSLKKMSEMTGYSYSYLSRYFKNIVNMSFNEYVNRYKIDKACYLLRTSNTSILQCALESGYDSLRSFNRNFLKYMLVSPKEYRKYQRMPKRI